MLSSHCRWDGLGLCIVEITAVKVEPASTRSMKIVLVLVVFQGFSAIYCDSNAARLGL